ncbi:hypothetical protein M9R32_12095 [Paenisporosarcina quisquiliarum]|uniref:Uncharacterized protein n=1 Tax=Paenisporosarcina quisquiliarum TaxID=365346 RepID=A0A9X3LHP4_9BACL|nr:hypothetical protein [Paenisporosarcina quisquiliarum]MCZ8537927.1 hypothetical protein [Paenisporosarcina quisquiliarum]
MKTKHMIFLLVPFILVFTLFITGWKSNKVKEEPEKVIAEEKHERIVLLSVPSEIRHQIIYLMADKITWMDYENFVIQVGDSVQETLYRFPNWYHGKYPPELFYKDVNGDSFGDIIVVLNNDRAGIGNPKKDIHILNFIKERVAYEEAPIESMEKTKTTIKSKVTLGKQGNIVTIHIEDEKYIIDITKYHYRNPREPLSISFDLTTYAVENGQLFGRVPVFISQDSFIGGVIGLLRLEYDWNGEEYAVKQIDFIEYNSEDDQFFFSY